MTVHAHKQGHAPRQALANLTTSNVKTLAAGHGVHSMGPFDAKGPDLETSPNTSATPIFAHDFSRIPVHSKAPVRVQAKLRINSPGDKYEQEAERIAEQVTTMPEKLQRKRDDTGRFSKCRNLQAAAERLQTHSLPENNSGEVAAPAIVHEVLKSSGEPLDSCTRASMEAHFGHDFSRVRLHTDARAGESARTLKARAYTVGNHVVFSAGQFAPDTRGGTKLLAHELTHVVQNGQTAIQRQAVEGESLLPDLLNRGIGTVDNQTEETFIAEASETKDSAKMFTPLPPGTWGGSSPARGPKGEQLHDIDFVFATPTTPINGKTSGKFKIGSNDATIVSDPNDKQNSKIEDFTGYIGLDKPAKAPNPATGSIDNAACPPGKAWLAGQHIAPIFVLIKPAPEVSDSFSSLTLPDKDPKITGRATVDCKAGVWRFQLDPFVSTVSIYIYYYTSGHYPAPTPTDDSGELTNVNKQNCKSMVEELYRDRADVHKNWSAYRRDHLHEDYHYKIEWQSAMNKFVPKFESEVEKMQVPFADAKTAGEATKLLEPAVQNKHGHEYSKEWRIWNDIPDRPGSGGAYLAQVPAMENLIKRIVKYARDEKKWLPVGYTPGNVSPLSDTKKGDKNSPPQGK